MKVEELVYLLTRLPQHYTVQVSKIETSDATETYVRTFNIEDVTMMNDRILINVDED